MQFHVVVEQEPRCKLTSVASAVVHLIGAYFIYDISYPTPFNSLLLMIQHHILGLKDDEPDTTPVVETVTSLQRMDI